MGDVPAFSSWNNTGKTERAIASGLAFKAAIDRCPTPGSARFSEAMTCLHNRTGSASFASRLTHENLVLVEAAVPIHSVSTEVLPNPAGAETSVKPRSRPVPSSSSRCGRLIEPGGRRCGTSLAATTPNSSSSDITRGVEDPVDWVKSHPPRRLLHCHRGRQARCRPHPERVDFDCRPVVNHPGDRCSG